MKIKTRQRRRLKTGCPACGSPGFKYETAPETSASPESCLANLVEQLKDSAAKLYELAKAERQKLVRLAPQYRCDDKYNAEGEYIQNIKLAMDLRRAALQTAKKLESESSS